MSEATAAPAASAPAAAPATDAPAAAPAAPQTFKRGEGPQPTLEQAKERMQTIGRVFDDEPDGDASAFWDDDTEGNLLAFPQGEQEGEAAAAEEAPEAEAGEQDDRYALLENQNRALQGYLNSVVQALQQQGPMVQQLAERERARDQQAQMTAAERERLQKLEELKEDPEAYARFQIEESVRGVVADLIAQERQATGQRQQVARLQAAQQDAFADVQEMREEFPWFADALDDYRTHAIEHYKTHYGLDDAAADQVLMDQLFQAAINAHLRGESAGDALYSIVGAWDYDPDEAAWDADENSPAPEQAQQAPQPAPQPVQGAQAFADRRLAAQPPADAASAGTATENLRHLMKLAHDGDEQAQQRLIAHASKLGDISKPETRRKLFAELGY